MEFLDDNLIKSFEALRSSLGGYEQDILLTRDHIAIEWWYDLLEMDFEEVKSLYPEFWETGMSHRDLAYAIISGSTA